MDQLLPRAPPICRPSPAGLDQPINRAASAASAHAAARSYLPFLDQYSRSMRFWAPDSAAFCFAARGRPSGARTAGLGLALPCVPPCSLTQLAAVVLRPPPPLLPAAEGLVLEEPNISVQAVPRPSQAPSSSGGSSGGGFGSGGGGGGGGGAGLPFVLAEAPPPAWLAGGTMASWSWQ